MACSGARANEAFVPLGGTTVLWDSFTASLRMRNACSSLERGDMKNLLRVNLVHPRRELAITRPAILRTVIWPRRRTLLDKPTPLRMGHGFKAVMCPQLAVDVVQVVAERLGGNVQRARNGRWVVAPCEERKDAPFLVG